MVAELGFANRIINETQGIEFDYEPPSDDAIDNVYLADKIFIKGVNATRSENDTNADYIVEKSLETIGIRNYIHKYHIGLQPYYFKLKNEDQLNLLTSELAK